jgi:hypothetical protein
VENGEGEDVVHVVAHVGVKNDVHRRGRGGDWMVGRGSRLRCARGRCRENTAGRSEQDGGGPEQERNAEAARRRAGDGGSGGGGGAR